MLERRSGQAAGYNRNAYLQFDLSSVTHVSAASLPLYGGSEGSGGSTTATVYQTGRD